MEKYYVLVAGSGVTSRANLEALMEDHYYSSGPDGVLVLPITAKPSQGQIFAAQLAKDKSKEIIIFATENTQYEGLGSSSVTVTDAPLKDAVKHLKGSKASAFLLWSDDDEDCANALALCTQSKVPAFDLTDGLVPVTAVKGLKEEPTPDIPVQETLNNSNPEEEDEEYDEEYDEDYDEEDEEEDDVNDDIYFGVQALIKAIAIAVADELDARKKPSKGDMA